MGTISDKLAYLAESKEQIRQAIEGMGVSVPSNTPFRQYGEKVKEIENMTEKWEKVASKKQYDEWHLKTEYGTFVKLVSTEIIGYTNQAQMTGFSSASQTFNIELPELHLDDTTYTIFSSVFGAYVLVTATCRIEKTTAKIEIGWLNPTSGTSYTPRNSGTVQIGNIICEYFVSK